MVSLALHAAIAVTLLTLHMQRSLPPPTAEISVSLVTEAPNVTPQRVAVTQVPPPPMLETVVEPAVAAIAVPSPEVMPSPVAVVAAQEPNASPVIAQAPQAPRAAAPAAPARPHAVAAARPASVPTVTPLPVPAARPAAVAVIVPARPVAGMSTNRPPVYPALAQRRHDEGVVMLRVSVSTDGQPTAVSVLRGSGHETLDEAAVAAVRAWRFEPATRDGIPVAANADVPVAFTMPR